MGYSAEERALIWLGACVALDPREKTALLNAAPSAKILYENFEKFCAEVIFKDKKGVYKKSSLKEREKELYAVLAKLEEKHFFAVTVASEDYPESLAAIDNPPLVLYGAGNRELLRKKMFCIVGSRRTPPYAEVFGSRIAEELASQFAIVTGLAEGGDSAALKGALKGGSAICVLPCGLDECYPASHISLKERVIKEGLLLTEYPLGEKVKKYSFHARNRILAGLTSGTLVLSAGEKSGALITADYALNFGREVFALPYGVGTTQGVGCNLLIKRGAFLCDCTQDVLDVFGIYLPEEKAAPELSEEEQKIADVLMDGEELHSAVISERSGLPIYEVAALLTELEIKGVVVKVGGNQYKRI